MGLAETTIFYLLVGAGVATAVFLSSRGGAFRAVTAVVFWPLYLPVLLTPRAGEEPPPAENARPERDELSTAIEQVESELDSAFSSLDGWAEGVLAREAERIRELRTLWIAQAHRIREMDRLLAAQTESTSVASEQEPAATRSPCDPNDRRLQSEQARRANLNRLRQVRQQAHGDLLGTLAWVRELVSMIHLAKFTGAPASRAEELVAQIAATVEGVSAVTWQETFPPDSQGAQRVNPAVAAH
jgi:hypothetical protein